MVLPIRIANLKIYPPSDTQSHWEIWKVNSVNLDETYMNQFGSRNEALAFCQGYSK